MAQPSISFNPINREGTLPQRVNPLKTFHDTNIYDLPHDPATQTTNSHTNSKRTAQVSSKARSKAITAGITETLTTSCQNDDEVFEVSSPKRRKTPMKRAQSMKAFKVPSQIQTPTGSGMKQVYQKDCSKSQLATPPATNKKSNRRGNSAIQTQTKQSELFPNSNVTKVLPAQKRSDHDVPWSINSLQGFITTEDRLKFNSNGIANTTLQKLAAFRYKPVEENCTSSVQEDEINVLHIHTNVKQDQARPYLRELDHTLIDHSHMLDNDSFLEEALWRDDSQIQSVEAPLWFESNPAAAIPQEPMNCTSCIADGTLHASEPGAHTSRASVPPLELQAFDSSRSLTEDELMHGKMDVLDRQFNAVDIINEKIADPFESPENCSYDGVSTDCLPYASSHNTANTTTHQSSTMCRLAEQDFDDGIADEDLLAFFDDTHMPELPVVLQGTEPVTCTGAAPHVREAPCWEHSLKAQRQPSAVPSLVQADEDDEYPMDEDFEDAMLELPGLHASVFETFNTPPSIEIQPDDTCTDKEIYDKTLQFSSPRSFVSELEDVAQPTSVNMSRQSDAHVLEPPVTSEEADWG
ncbi:hypothetical protein ACMFMF_002139 [Clarireedia jacksonii]